MPSGQTGVRAKTSQGHRVIHPESTQTPVAGAASPPGKTSSLAATSVIGSPQRQSFSDYCALARTYLEKGDGVGCERAMLEALMGLTIGGNEHPGRARPEEPAIDELRLASRVLSRLAIQGRHRSFETYRALTRIYLALGKFVAASNYIQQALKLRPGHVDALRLRELIPSGAVKRNTSAPLKKPSPLPWYQFHY